MKPLALTFLTATLAIPQTTLSDESSNGVRHTAIRIPFDSLSSILNACQRELRRSDRPRVTVLHLFGNTGGTPLPKPLSAYAYDYWLNLFLTSPANPSDFAEMIAIDNDAVLRYRDTQGQLGRRILVGRDPLILTFHDHQFEILYIALTRSFLLSRADIFLKSSAELTPTLGTKLLAHLETLFPSRETHISVRPDGWFVFSPHYPFRNPFDPATNPPTESGFDQTRQLDCGNFQSKTICSLHPSPP